MYLIDRITGAILGIVFGVLLGLYTLGQGIFNAIGSVGLFFRDFALVTYNSTLDFLRHMDKFIGTLLTELAKDIATFALTVGKLIYKWAEFSLNIFTSFPNPFLMLGYAIITAAFITPLYALASVLSIARLVLSVTGDIVNFGLNLSFNAIKNVLNIASTAINAVWNIGGSLIATAAISVVLPVVGFFVGLVTGVKGAFTSMLTSRAASSNQNQLAHQDQNNLTPQRVAIQPPRYNINNFINQNVIHNLPVPRALTANHLNNELRDAILLLPPSNDHIAIKSRMDLVDNIQPSKMIYNRYNQEYTCSITLDNLFDLQNPITVTYGSSAHIKVFDENSFVQMINTATGFASLPESRTALTATTRTWNPTPDQRGIVSDDGKITIYKGIPAVVKNSCLNALASGPSASVDEQKDEAVVSSAVSYQRL